MLRKIWDFIKKEGILYKNHPSIHGVLCGLLLVALIWMIKSYIG